MGCMFSRGSRVGLACSQFSIALRRGTGHPGLSAEYNELCYRLRGFVLGARSLARVPGLEALTGIARHRFAVTNWLSAAFRTVQVVVRTSPTAASAAAAIA